MNAERKNRNRRLPVGRNEDVEYSAELADADDLEAQERAKAADRRQTGGQETFHFPGLR
jgi:hypothetical protein